MSIRRLNYVDAERALLCGVLLHGDGALDRVMLIPDDFADVRHREIFAAMRRLRDRNEPCNDLQVLDAELGARSEAVGGLGYCAELLEAAAIETSMGDYQRLIRRGAITRAVLIALSEVQGGIAEGEDLIAEVQEATSKLSHSLEDHGQEISDVTRAVFKHLESLEGGGVWGVPTGYEVLDKVMGGLTPGNLFILAGRPSMGKSALSRSIADNANASAKEGEEPPGIHVFTPEDNAIAYGTRQLADMARVPLDKIRALELNRGQMKDLMGAGNELARRRNWVIDDSSGISSQDLILRVRKRKQENNTKLVVVDYVQMMRETSVPLHDKRMQVEVAAENLVTLARSEKIAVLALSQLSRDCEKRPDKRPLLSDLRESGALEQLAEGVLMVYRDEYYNEDTDQKGITEVLVRKNKGGTTGMVELWWDARTATHREMTNRKDDGYYDGRH